MTRAGLGRLALAGFVLLLSGGRAPVWADQHDAAAARSALERAQEATRAAQAEARAAAVAVKSALDRIQAATRAVEVEVRDAVAKAKAITPGTPMAEREAVARRLLDLRERLRRLRAEADAERQRITALPDAAGVVVVADVVGLSVPQAEKTLRDLGLVPATQGGGTPRAQGCCVDRPGAPHLGVNTCPPRQIPCAWLESGGGPGAGPASPGPRTVESQLPAAGTRAPKGSGVTLMARTPPPDPGRLVPDVRGRPVAEATAALKQAGFEAGLQGGAPPSSKREEYTVERTDPAPGTMLASGRAVTLFVRPGYVEPTRAVPDVTGRRYAEAEAVLRQAGFAVAAEGGGVPPAKAQEHTVEAQTPRAGEARAPGSPVTLRIYATYVEPTRAVPDVTGRRYAEAEAALRQAGFAVAAEGGGAPPAKAQEHTVEAQTPRAGEARAPGSPVTLRIYATYVEPTRAVPDVTGRRYAEAEAVLRQAGFAVAAEGGGAPPAKAQEHTVEAQTPRAGEARAPGSAVTLRIYATYVEPSTPGRGPGTGAGGARPVGPVVPMGSLGCPEIPGTKLSAGGSNVGTDRMRCLYNDVSADFTWVPADSPNRWPCGRLRSAGGHMVELPTARYPVNSVSVPSPTRSAEVVVRSAVRRPDALPVEAMARVLAEQIEPRAAPCGGSPPPTQVQPVIPPRPPPSGRGGSGGAPATVPWRDPCPGRPMSPLGQGCD